MHLEEGDNFYDEKCLFQAVVNKKNMLDVDMKQTRFKQKPDKRDS